MFGSYGPTPYDLRFTLLRVPVRVHPTFWALSAVLGILWNRNDPAGMFIVVAVIFISVLVHEMGHALTMRYFGHNPSIVLHLMGGHASYQSMDSPWASFGTSYGRRQESRWSKVIISAAGPAAGLLLAGIVFLYVVVGAVSFGALAVPADAVDNEFVYRLAQFSFFMLQVNIVWSIFNLLPVYPLDGGHITREIAQMVSYDGLRISLWISIVVAAGIAVLGITLREVFLVVMFAYLAVMSYQMLQGPDGFGGGGGYGDGGGGRPW